MDFSTKQEGIIESKTPSARALSQFKTEILLDWEKNARSQIKAAGTLQQPLLIDTVPAFIDNLVEALAEDHPRYLATSGSSISTEHGGERARLTQYSPDQLIQEYHVLRDAIVTKLTATLELTQRDWTILQKSFDQAIQESMMAFFLVHMQIREQFIAGLSHDLRNPLSAMKMAAELTIAMIADLPDSSLRADLTGLAQRIVNNSKRADRLIRSLLDASALQFGERLVVKTRECEAVSLIREVISELDRRDQERIQVVSITVHGYWDCDALRRAIENLIANALKYGKAESIILVRVQSTEGRVLISVHNDGPSIPIEEQETLFQAFRRSWNAKTSGTQGWGIGLALVREVAEGHGGSVVVDSAPERGTTFLIDIPQDSRPHIQAPTTA